MLRDAVQLLSHDCLVVLSGCKGSDAALFRTAQAHTLRKQACYTFVFFAVSTVGNTEEKFPHLNSMSEINSLCFCVCVNWEFCLVREKWK